MAMSLYNGTRDKSVANEISIDDYVGFIKHGAYKKIVDEGRRLKSIWKQTGTDADKSAYKDYKNFKVPCVTGSCTMHNDGGKSEGNIKEMNGFIVLDIDTEVTQDVKDQIKQDPYTHVMHTSFGGDGFCVFVAINPAKFLESWQGLAQYFYTKYNVTVDASCKNRNRLRFMSCDEDIVFNEKPKKYIPVNSKQYAEPKNVDFIFSQSDFDAILEQIKTRSIDLCKEDYHRYVRIGMALADEFGAAGESYFHFICQYGLKYREKDAIRDYKGFVANSQGKCKIGTLYYYAKQEGIEVYSAKTEKIINVVKVAKVQGNPTVEAVRDTLQSVGMEPNENDLKVIKNLIDSQIDFTREINRDVSEIDQLENFIRMTFDPVLDNITKDVMVNGLPMHDKEMNDIILTCKKHMDFAVKDTDVRMILNSSCIGQKNIILDFFDENIDREDTGLIDGYADLIKPVNPFNRWAFKKWLCGMVHNWIADRFDPIVSPLTMVLYGERQGTGKTSFFRNMLPEDLRPYIDSTTKLNHKKPETLFALASNLMHIDNEFGSALAKDVDMFKDISDLDVISARRPYARSVVKFRRISGLAATSNRNKLIKDPTGENRRILGAYVESTDYEKMIRYDTVGMIMEAYYLVKSGFDWKIQKQEDIDYLKENMQDNEDDMPSADLWCKLFSTEQTRDHQEARILNQGEMLNYMHLHLQYRVTKFELGDALTRMKLKPASHRQPGGSVKKGYRVFCNQQVILSERAGMPLTAKMLEPSN